MHSTHTVEMAAIFQNCVYRTKLQWPYTKISSLIKIHLRASNGLQDKHVIHLSPRFFGWSSLPCVHCNVHAILVSMWNHPLINSLSFYLNNKWKRHNQAKIIKKSAILFWLFNMIICCKHVQRLELQFFFNFCVAHLPIKRDIETEFPYFLFRTCMCRFSDVWQIHTTFYSWCTWLFGIIVCA